MDTFLFTLLLPVGGFTLGGIIGFVFGSIQRAALRRHQRTQKGAGLTSGWALIPGSMRRTALLLVSLVVVQITCPIFFASETLPWLVSAGIVMGYGWILFTRLHVGETRT